MAYLKVRHSCQKQCKRLSSFPVFCQDPRSQTLQWPSNIQVSKGKRICKTKDLGSHITVVVGSIAHLLEKCGPAVLHTYLWQGITKSRASELHQSSVLVGKICSLWDTEGKIETNTVSSVFAEDVLYECLYYQKPFPYRNHIALGHGAYIVGQMHN